jgi:chromosome segregation ATPase
LRTAFFAFAIFLSTIVLVLSVAGVVGVWVVERVATDVTMEATAAIDEAAQAARDGIQRVNARVARARETVDTIEAAATLASRDVVERGVAMTPLSEEKAQQLNAEIQDAVDSFENFRQGLLAIVHLIRAIDRMPMVELPEPDPERLREASEKIDGLEMRAEELGNRLSGFRAGAAGAALEVREAAMQVSDRLAEVQEDLTQVNARLSAVQARAIHLQQTLPTTFALIAIASTLLLVWVAYSQVVVIRSSWSQLRAQSGGER